LIDDIVKHFELATGRPAQEASTPGYPGKTLTKNEGEMVMLDEYRSLTGKIMYLTTKIAPELSNAARELAQHMSNPGEEHWKALERAVGYVATTKGKGLTYRAPKTLRPIMFADSNYATNEDNRRSVTGNLYTIGGSLVNWMSKTQSTVTLSSTEAEYVSLATCAQELRFTQMILEEIAEPLGPGIIYEDNVGAIFLVKNKQVSQRTKHIDVRHHYVRELYEKKQLEVRFIRSEENHADLLTKNLPEEMFVRHTKAIRSGVLERRREDVVIMMELPNPEDESKWSAHVNEVLRPRTSPTTEDGLTNWKVVEPKYRKIKGAFRDCSKG
jgi:hypothetical protein